MMLLILAARPQPHLPAAVLELHSDVLAVVDALRRHVVEVVAREQVGGDHAHFGPREAGNKDTRLVSAPPNTPKAARENLLDPDARVSARGEGVISFHAARVVD